MYLVEGDPGAGKTTLALQFLREAVRLGQLEGTVGTTLNEPNPRTFYGGGAEGYTDYPALAS